MYSTGPTDYADAHGSLVSSKDSDFDFALLSLCSMQRLQIYDIYFLYRNISRGKTDRTVLLEMVTEFK